MSKYFKAITYRRFIACLRIHICPNIELGKCHLQANVDPIPYVTKYKQLTVISTFLIVLTYCEAYEWLVFITL